MTPNIFHALLTHHPREDRSPKENFLTEAFAHTLRTNPEICRAWLSSITGEQRQILSGHLEVETQKSYFAPDGKTWSIMDMVITCGLASGGEVTVFSEHKWGSPANGAQLDSYLAIAASRPKTSVIFIAPTVMQIADVKHHTTAVKALRWNEIHAFFQSHEAETSAGSVGEFVEFLALQGFGPEKPLSWPKLAAYTASRSVEKDCTRLVAQLDECDWKFLPARFQVQQIAYDKMKWGRIGIELGKWNPCIFVGFLLDGDDHKLPLVSPSSIDLMLSLDMSETKKNIDQAVLGRIADLLAAPGVNVLHGNQLKKSPWRKLVVREPLADTIRGRLTEADQVKAIYDRLVHWSTVMFQSGQLVTAIEKM